MMKPTKPRSMAFIRHVGTCLIAVLAGVPAGASAIPQEIVAENPGDPADDLMEPLCFESWTTWGGITTIGGGTANGGKGVYTYNPKEPVNSNNPLGEWIIQHSISGLCSLVEQVRETIEYCKTNPVDCPSRILTIITEDV